MTHQEIFDKVLTHLRAQGVAATGGFQCTYRQTTPEGKTLMCAVGCLIKDEFYNPDFEGKTPNDPNVNWAIAQSLGIEEGFTHYSTTNLLCDLQDAHDHELDMEGVDAWEQQMQRIAEEYELTYTPGVA